MSGTEYDDSGEFDIAIDETLVGGVWANLVWVTQSVHEFTIDFVRLDFRTRTGAVVARVAMSPLLVTRLLEALTTEWQEYQRRTLPPEVS